MTYPWTKDVCKLVDNLGQAVAFQTSVERYRGKLVNGKFDDTLPTILGLVFYDFMPPCFMPRESMPP